MRKKILFIALAIAFKINAQVNLVMNPSFETHTACPDNNGGDVYKVVGWDTCRSTPDYFNSCDSFTAFSTPSNLFGYQIPADGSAYAGMCTYDAAGFYREIIIGQLTSSLIIGQKYFISFKVTRGSCNCTMGYSTNKMGVKFTKVKQSYTAINNSAHFYSNQVLTDTLNWIALFGSYIADSAYSYLMVGNFFDDFNTTILNDGPSSLAYYYVDRFCISTDSSFCSNYNEVGIEENTVENKHLFFPNPVDKFLQIYLKDFTIYNSQGSEVRFERNEPLIPKSINVEKWPEGIYFIVTKSKNYKLIINH